MVNESKYELNAETGRYDLYYKGFDYNTLTRHEWKKVAEAQTEDEARKRCADMLDFSCGEDAQ